MNQITFPLQPGMQGPAVTDLQDAILLLIDRQIIKTFPAPNRPTVEELQASAGRIRLERTQSRFGDATQQLLRFFQNQQGLGDHFAGIVEATTAAALNRLLTELGVLDSNHKFEVSGRVYSADRAGVDGLRVQMVDKNAGPDVLLAEGMSDEVGKYALSCSATKVTEQGKSAPDLQVRVLRGDRFLGASDVRYNATPSEALDVLLPTAADDLLPSEYATLTGAITAHFHGKLADLKEEGDRSDITYLANKTGWDARAVALAALGDQFSARTASAAGAPPAIAAEFFYALFRAGIAANEDTLYRVDAKALEMIWTQAAQQGVIPDSMVNTVPEVVKRFQTLSAQKLLTGPALTGVSSLKEMLASSGLTDAQQQEFANIFVSRRNDTPAFWGAVEAAFGQDMAKRMQLDGKLAFLTVNNAPLMERLRGVVGGQGLSDAVQLAEAGFHRGAKWHDLLSANTPIPNEIPGDTLEAKRVNYADFLAAQVRLSYPTAAVAEMVKSGDLQVNVPAQVHGFLTEHQGRFEIGAQPVQRYIVRNNVQIAPDTVTQIERLQRVYQITPTDGAMTGLLKRGIDSACQVARFDKEEFVKQFGQDLGGADRAALVHDKSRQVHGATLNIAISYLTARNGIPLGASPMALGPGGSEAGGQLIQPAPGGSSESAFDVIAYPTLERLFGSLDFCACDHCRSVLSPAAYLVDLLHFLDRAATEPGKENPQAVLLERRPDIQHLPLTCENTNTALPYIDVVNEALEYFIANNAQSLSLKDYTGHDTNGVPSEDLMASPQFVMDTAYEHLQGERFPLPLPFHQPLENLRQFFNKFEVPLSLAMERLRKSDDLESGPNGYGWRDILMEDVRLSPEEYEILTDSAAVPLGRMYGFPNGTADADVIAALANAKGFARRVGISYDELVQLLQTRFVNPNSDLIPKLRRLGVGFATLQALHDGTITDDAFDALLPAGAGRPDPAQYDGDVKAWIKNPDNFARIMSIITLAIPGDSSGESNFDKLELRYSKPAAGPTDTSTLLGSPDYARLLRFIRLWKKTGWTIDQTDAAICALYRMDLEPLQPGDIDSLAELDAGFLTLLPRLGIVFRVMSALNLTAERDLLSLLACWSNIGTHDGRDWLARALRLSAGELQLLTSLTGLDPFAPPDLTQPAILQLISLVSAMKDRTLKPTAALYLVWNQDLSGRSAPSAARTLEFARTLRDDFVGIDNQFSATEDPGSDIARTRVALVYGQETANAFFALIDNALELDVPYTHGTPSLEAAITTIDANIAYDDFRRRLSHRGLLDVATRDALKGIPGATAEFQNAVDALFARGADISGSFFTRCPELKPLHDAYVASTETPEKKRSDLLAAFQPELARRRRRQQALQRLSAAASVDIGFAQSLLDPEAAPFPLHAAGQADQPALNDVFALQTAGLAAQFFFRDTASGNVDLSVAAAANLDYSTAGINRLPANPQPGAAISGVWKGRIEAPEPGFYNIVIEADADVVSLTIADEVRPLTHSGGIWRNTAPLELKAGTLYAIVLKVEKVKDKLAVKWETPKRPREVIPGRYLYSPTILAVFSELYIRFLKSASLASRLQLTANELSHFATDPEYKIDGSEWLNCLPAVTDATPAIAEKLLTPLEALLDFARIKAALSPDDEQVLGIIQDPAAAAATAGGALFNFTRWDSASLNAVLSHFGDTTAGLRRFDLFRRVYDAFAVILPMGVSGESLIRATTNRPNSATARELQAAMRARYSVADGRDLIRPINDAMRALQRDALVASILHRMRENSETAQIDTPDKLFEYFLMDVQMEPCMLTSRIRHALSSAQLFIQRCLMNLEPRVSPASINAAQWTWMKRYRVWEANRKVFLWPENWLEPELRDDKSPFFKEIESELLQQDITEDTAVTALLNYLANLEGVAKLEPCGVHYEEPTETRGEVIHLVARTAGANREYYYRRYERGYWSPLEPIKLDIEDNPITPYVWNNRLLLFWLRLVKKGPNAASKPAGRKLLTSMRTDELPNDPDVSVQAVLCWSEYYNNKWQAAKTSDVNLPTRIHTSPPGVFDRATIRLGVAVEGDALRVYINDTPIRPLIAGVDVVSWPGSFLFYNTHSLPVRGDEPQSMPPAPAPVKRRDLAGDRHSFTFKYSAPAVGGFTRQILSTRIPFEFTSPRHALKDAWNGPAFFADSRHVFLVTSDHQPVPVRGHGDFGIFDTAGVLLGAEIPPLVVEPAPPKRPKAWSDGSPLGSEHSLVDPVPMRRFVTEDAYIRQGLGTTLNVQYGDREIGPSGSNGSAKTS